MAKKKKKAAPKKKKKAAPKKKKKAAKKKKKAAPKKKKKAAPKKKRKKLLRKRKKEDSKSLIFQENFFKFSFSYLFKRKKRGITPFFLLFSFKNIIHLYNATCTESKLRTFR